jgi:hypothetical protein
MTNATRVIVTTQAQFEKMTAHPGALSGTFNPITGRGEVLFATQTAAQTAAREL